MAVLGEAPGRVEDEAGQPFVGPAGKLLRAAFRRFDLVPEEMAILNTVSGWPRGTPKQSHIDACEHNLWMQLRLIRPRYVLVLGSVAAHQAAGLDLKGIQGFLGHSTIGVKRPTPTST